MSFSFNHAPPPPTEGAAAVVCLRRSPVYTSTEIERLIGMPAMRPIPCSSLVDPKRSFIPHATFAWPKPLKLPG